MKTLAQLRREFDDADDALVAALNRRFALAAEMRALKAREHLPRVDPARERAIIERVMAQVAPADRDTVCGVYERIFGGSRGEIETIARGVAVREGKVLLCRARGAASAYLPGGHIEFGETGRVALEREIREETGLESAAGELLGVVENTFDQQGRRHAEINLVYALTLADAAVSSREDWIGFEWCALSALESAVLLPAAMIPLVRTAAERG